MVDIQAFHACTERRTGSSMSLCTTTTSRCSDTLRVQHGTVAGCQVGIRWAPYRYLAAFTSRNFAVSRNLELVFSGHERPAYAGGKGSLVDRYVKVSDVVRTIASEHGFHRFIQQIFATLAGVAVTIVQAGETDAALLQRLAKEHGMRIFYRRQLDCIGIRPESVGLPWSCCNYNMKDSPLTDISFSSNLARHVGRVEAARPRPTSQDKHRSVSQNHITAPRDTLRRDRRSRWTPTCTKALCKSRAARWRYIHRLPPMLRRWTKSRVNRFVAAEVVGYSGKPS